MIPISRSLRIGLAAASVNFSTKNLARVLWLSALVGSLVVAMPAPRMFAQEEVVATNCTEAPEEPEGPMEEAPADGGSPQLAFGQNSPTGVAGIFNGQITTGGNYDPLSRNAKRVIDDIVVPGCIGAYPLKMTRYWNSRTTPEDGSPRICPGWTHEYMWLGEAPRPDFSGIVFMPSGAELGTCGWDRGTSEKWEDATHFRMADGGTVIFDSASHRAVAIADPFGKTTTIDYDNYGKVWKVTEPGGRFLLFTYVDNPWSTDYWNPRLLIKVEAFDGRGNRIDNVTYQYCPIYPGGGCIFGCREKMMLSEVHYSDGTSAIYTYREDNIAEWVNGQANPREWPLLKTADDMRHQGGAMRRIQYGYQSGTIRNPHNGVVSSVPHGVIKREETFDGNTIISSVAGNWDSREETTRVSLTRTFQYTRLPPCAPDEPCGGCDDPQLLLSYEDFEGHTTYLDYDSQNFVNRVTDARTSSGLGDPLYTTRYMRHAWGPNATEGIGEITDIIHPDGKTIHYDYESDPHYVHRVTDERGSVTEHTRDGLHRITRTDYKDSAANGSTLLAYEEVGYDDGNGHGQVSWHRMKNGAYVHYQYDSRGLLIKKWNPTWSSAPVESEPKTTYSYYEPNDPIAGNAWIDRVKTETDPRQNTTTYEYDIAVEGPNTGQPCPGRGLVTKITHPDGRYQSFGFNIYGDKIWEENELRQRTRYEYDDYGRVTKITDPLGHFETFDYKPTTGDPTSQNNSYSHTTNSVRQHVAKEQSIITTNNYDGDFRKLSTTVGSGSDTSITSFAYDAVGNQTRVIDPRPSHWVTETDYDSRNRKTEVREPLNHRTQFFYEDGLNLTRIIRPDGTTAFKTYDGLNRITMDKVPMLGEGPDSDYVITQFFYHSAGVHGASLLSKVRDGNGNETDFTYEPSGLKETMTYPPPLPGGTRDTQTWTYDGNKNLIARRAPGGAIQTFAYDSRNRKTAMRWSNGIDFSDFDYDWAGRLTFAQNPYSTVVRGYDDAGRMTLDQQTMPGAAPTPVPLIDRPSVVSRRTHGSAGDFDIALPLTGDPGIESRNGGTYKIVATFQHLVNLNGNAIVSAGIGTVSATTSASTETGGTAITIDLVNVSTAQKLVVMLSVSDGGISDEIAIPMRVLWGDANATGSVTSSDASMIQSQIGQPVSSSNFRCDANVTGDIDNADNKVATVNAGTGIASPPPSTTQAVSYEHDNDGRVRHLWVPGVGYDYTQTYDSLGRLKTILPTGGQSPSYQYGYDEASNVTRRDSFANGTWIDYEPDALNRIGALKVNLPSAMPMPYGTPTTRNWFTREVYGYDMMNRLSSVNRDEDTAAIDWFGYYLDGELQRAEYALPVSSPTPTPSATPTPPPGNQVATPVLNPPGCNLYGVSQSVTVTCSTAGASIRYTTNGTIPSSTNGMLISSGGSFNVGVPLNGEKTVRAIAYKTGMADSTIAEETYSNEGGGQAPQSATRRSLNYALDKAGNRTGEAGVTADGEPFNYEPNGLNQYTIAHGDTSIQNGANHEISAYQGVNYVYLNDTRLARVSMTDASGLHLYRLGYDALGRLVRRTWGDGPGMSVTYYIYDGEKPIYEFDPNGGTPSTNIYGRGIDEILYRSNHGSGQHFMQDHEGSVIAVLGGNGALLEWYRYDAFGAPMSIKDGAGTSFPTTQINNRFLFTGREYIPLFGFYEYRARAYHPGIGRFMSEDPKLFDADDYNLYRYVKNDPWDLSDPMGLAPTVVSPEVDRVSLEALKVVRDISNNNSDGKGVGLERGKTIGPLNGRIQYSKDTSVGEPVNGDMTHQRILYPDPPGGENGKRDSFAHVHTNSNTTDPQGRPDPRGTLTSPPDKNNGDKSNTTVYTTSKDGKITERYRQSDDARQRDHHADSVTERLKNGKWEEVEKRPAVKLPGLQRK